MKGVWAVPVALVALAIGWSIWRNSEVQRPNVAGGACLTRLGSLAHAIQIYAEDHDERLMPALAWSEAAAPYAGSSESMNCPAAKRFGYAYRKDLDAKKLTEIDHRDEEIMVFDSTLLVKNATGTLDDLPSPPRHGDRNSVLYVDGHAASLDSGHRPSKGGG